MFVIVDGSPIATKDIVVVVASSLHSMMTMLPQNNIISCKGSNSREANLNTDVLIMEGS